MQEHLVIIGGVAAGTKAAAKARREDPNLKITIYTDEKYISYSACGLPYFIGGFFDESKRLLARSVSDFKEKENINIYTEHRVLEIFPDSKEVEVMNLQDNTKFKEPFSKLLIATGASPFIPKVEGIDLKHVFTLRTVPDAISIKESLPDIRNAVVIGAGYIGIEAMEAFVSQGINTTIVELGDQILPVLDSDMAYQVEKYIKEELKPKSGAKINIITKDALKRITGNEQGFVKQVETTSGKLIDADIVLIAVGVKPNVELAKKAGIEIGETGAIKVNSKMQTNIDYIYAAGDCAEQTHIITGRPAWIPLGSTANKQGRIAAVNITGGYAEFKGVLGSAVTKIFDYTISRTGLSEKEAQKLGIKYEVAIVPHRDRAGYMPGVGQIIIKLLAQTNTGKILGVQVIGTGDADKRTNIIATAINAGMSVDDLIDTDLTYAPPYSPAIDPILTAGQILQNKLSKRTSSISAQKLEEYLENNVECCLLDANGLYTYAKSHCDCTQPIKAKLNILQDKDKKIIVFCEGGMNSYILSQKLKNEGYTDVKFIDGGLCACKKIPS